MQFEQMVNKELIIKFLTGESTEVENLIIKKWLNNKVENKKLFDEIEFIWKASGVTQNINNDDMNDDWNIILDKIGKTTEYQLIKPKDQQLETPNIFSNKAKKGLYSILKVAAIFILAFSLSYTIFYFTSNTSYKDSQAYNELITSKGQKSRLILSDGTKIWLNSESTLKYPSVFDKKKREVILVGEAYFDVQKHGNNVPFIVKTSEIDIEVTGTSFNVMAYPDEDIIETTLVEGSITLFRSNDKLPSMQPIYLKPDQKATLIKKGSQINLSKINIKKPTLAISNEHMQNGLSKGKEQIVISPEIDILPHTAWKDDKLIFKSESLENICYKLEKWFDVEINITDYKLGKTCYTGKFTHKESLNQVLEIIGLTTPIQYTFDKNLIIINKSIK